MTSKTIDNIVWFIPFKKLRDSVRDYLLFQYNIRNDIYDFLQQNKYLPCRDLIGRIPMFRKSIKEDCNFLSKYINFIKGFDDDDTKTVYDIISKICNYNNIEDKVLYSLDELKQLNKFTDETVEFWSKITTINKHAYLYNKYILPINYFEPEIFYYKYGMDYVKNLSQVKNKNIIDAGGFIGDSAIVFSDYTDKNVCSFEPFLQNYNMIFKTIELNKKNNIIPVNIALGDENKEISMYSHGNISSIFSLENSKESDINQIENKVKMMTLDSYVKENNIEVGLIKTDLEGFEQPFLKGAIETIKEQKPVLIISIYHNYSDFFEIKPMIENLDLGYKFKIVKPKSIQVITETKLLAEVY